ncbi:MAG: hypothetical protein V7724_10410 [Sediminicola sp.]|tara:strand:- start:10303 stop:11124 length:822 start_codon:yes stop_codon:yes gene_type:complete
MKLKEIPKSLYRAKWLEKRNLKDLQEGHGPLPVIVSLTTIPSRLHLVHLTIRSILSQKKKPKKTVLWIPEPLKSQLPKSLTTLECDLFEICTSPLHCPHKKLLHTLQAYPEANIVTVDDDLMYEPLWLETLYAQHLKYPKSIIANQSRFISHDADNVLLPYHQWPSHNSAGLTSARILPVGAAGVFYPQDSLSPTVFDVALFMQLAPKADDLWFKAMSLLKGTTSVQADIVPKQPLPIMGSQKVSLKKQNIGQDLNRQQWLALSEYFNLNLDQ